MKVGAFGAESADNNQPPGGSHGEEHEMFGCGRGCDFEARAENEAELMKKLQEHARTAHGFKDIPPELVAKVKAAIKDVK